MVALMMIVRHKLSDRISQHILTEENHLIQTAFFDVRTKRFAYVFRFGDIGGSLTFSMPQPAMMDRNSCVYSGSRSWTLREALKLMDASSDDTLFNAVDKIGLKLEPRKAEIEILVIDQALKVPTEN
jgi:hypothetical protein